MGKIKGKIKSRIHTTVFAVTTASVEKIEKKYLLGGNNIVVDNAAAFFKKVEDKITQDDIKKILDEMKNDSRESFASTLLKETISIIDKTSVKYGLSRGETVDIIIALYKNNCDAATGEKLEIKKTIEPKKEKFNLAYTGDKILFALYVKYPDFMSRNELLCLLTEMGLADKEETAQKSFWKELNKYSNNGYIYKSGMGNYIKYLLTDSGVKYLLKKAVVDKEARIASMILSLKGDMEKGKAFSYEKMLYELLLEKEKRLRQFEIIKRTGISNTHITRIVCELKNKKYVSIKQNAKCKYIILDVDKILREGLPPKNTNEWKIIKYLVNNGGKSSVKDLLRDIFHGFETVNNKTHIYRVLKSMDKDGNVKRETHPGKTMMIEITDAGTASFEVYVRKNIQGDDKISKEQDQIIPKKSMGAVKKRIIKILEKSNEVAFNEIKRRIQKEFNIAEQAVYVSLKELAAGGYVEEKHLVCLKKMEIKDE